MEIWKKFAAFVLTVTCLYGLYLLCTPQPTHTPHALRSSLVKTFHPILRHLNLVSTANHNKTFVIFIHSARPHFARRQTIRETWGTYTGTDDWTVLGLIFFVGLPPNPKDVETTRLLEEEQLEHGGDVVILNMTDTYRNLTEKAVGAFTWIVQNYPDASLVLKMDDDVFVNTFQLARSLNEIVNIHSSPNFFCLPLYNRKPIRNPRDKWYLSKEVYPSDSIPTYCMGWAYIVPMFIVKEMTSVFDVVKPRIHIDDAFMTGIIPITLNAMRKKKEKSWEDKRPIGIIDRRMWYRCDQCNPKENMNDLVRWSKIQEGNETMDGTKSVVNLKDNYIERIFFLVAHNPQFDDNFKRLWEKVKDIEGLN